MRVRTLSSVQSGGVSSSSSSMALMASGCLLMPAPRRWLNGMMDWRGRTGGNASMRGDEAGPGPTSPVPLHPSVLTSSALVRMRTASLLAKGALSACDCPSPSFHAVAFLFTIPLLVLSLSLLFSFRVCARACVCSSAGQGELQSLPPQPHARLTGL